MAQTELNIAIRAQDEASREIGKVENALSGLQGVAATAGKAFIGFGVAAAGSAIAFGVASIQKYSEVGDAVEKMSKRTGLAAEAVSGLRVAADASGTSIDTVEGAVRKMHLTIGSLADETSILNPLLGEMGMSFDDIMQMSPEEQFAAIGNAIGGIENASLRTEVAMAAFGKSGTDLIPMFENGAFSMDEWKQKAKELGVSFDDISAEKAAKLNDAIGAMKTAFSGLALQVGGELAPIITDLIENRLLPLAKQIIEMTPSLDDMKAGFNGVWASFTQAMDSFEASTGIISQLRDGFAEVWEKVSTELKPALDELWVAMQPLQPLMEDLAKVAIGALVIILKVLIELLLNALKLFVDITTIVAKVATTLLNVLKPAIEVTKLAINSLIEPIKQAIQMFDNMRAAAAAAFSAASNAVGRAVNAVLPGRAVGGPVTGGVPYMVGERGPELFVPRGSGTIVPNNALGGGGANISVMEGAVINVTSQADEQRLARTVVAEITRALQGTRNGLATSI